MLRLSPNVFPQILVDVEVELNKPVSSFSTVYQVCPRADNTSGMLKSPIVYCGLPAKYVMNEGFGTSDVAATYQPITFAGKRERSSWSGSRSCETFVDPENPSSPGDSSGCKGPIMQSNLSQAAASTHIRVRGRRLSGCKPCLGEVEVQTRQTFVENTDMEEGVGQTLPATSTRGAGLWCTEDMMRQVRFCDDSLLPSCCEADVCLTRTHSAVLAPNARATPPLHCDYPVKLETRDSGNAVIEDQCNGLHHSQRTSFRTPGCVLPPLFATHSGNDAAGLHAALPTPAGQPFDGDDFKRKLVAVLTRPENVEAVLLRLLYSSLVAVKKRSWSAGSGDHDSHVRGHVHLARELLGEVSRGEFQLPTARQVSRMKDLVIKMFCKSVAPDIFDGLKAAGDEPPFKDENACETQVNIGEHHDLLQLFPASSKLEIEDPLDLFSPDMLEQMDGVYTPSPAGGGVNDVAQDTHRAHFQHHNTSMQACGFGTGALDVVHAATLPNEMVAEIMAQNQALAEQLQALQAEYEEHRVRTSMLLSAEKIRMVKQQFLKMHQELMATQERLALEVAARQQANQEAAKPSIVNEASAVMPSSAPQLPKPAKEIRPRKRRASGASVESGSASLSNGEGLQTPPQPAPQAEAPPMPAVRPRQLAPGVHLSGLALKAPLPGHEYSLNANASTMLQFMGSTIVQCAPGAQSSGNPTTCVPQVGRSQSSLPILCAGRTILLPPKDAGSSSCDCRNA